MEVEVLLALEYIQQSEEEVHLQLKAQERRSTLIKKQGLRLRRKNMHG